MHAKTPDKVASTPRVPIKDQVLAIFSLASLKGRSSIPFSDYFEIFADLKDEFGQLLPGLIVNRTAFSTYSKQLDSALQDLIACSVAFPNPKLKFLQVSRDAASRHIAWLEETYGKAYLDSLQPVVDRLVQRLPPS
jgi:hypothetical protein